MDTVSPVRQAPCDPEATRRRWASLENLEHEITELWGYLNAATYRFLALLARFDREKGYERHGLINSAQWLNWQCGIGTVAGREKVRVARTLESLPLISDSFRRGVISYSKVRAMTRVATPANEEVLLSIAIYGTASHVEKLVRKYHWCERRDAGKLPWQAQEIERDLTSFYNANGMLVIHARLPAEVGAVVRKALEVAVDDLRECSKETTDASAEAQNPHRQQMSAGARRVDALKQIAETYLALRSEETGSGSSADRCQVVVHVDQAVLQQSVAVPENEPHRCELEEGPALARDTARRLCCDGTVVGITEGVDGEPLNIGRKTRSIPPAIKRALRSRDRGCRFPGCDRTRYTDGHHVKHWADGGETKVTNLVTLCGFHHTLVHEGGYGVKATDDGAFVFTRPDGRRVPENGERFRGSVQHAPASTSVVDDFEETLRWHMLQRHPELKIDTNTSRCGWRGESMDYNQAIESMQFHRDHALAVAGASRET